MRAVALAMVAFLALGAGLGQLGDTEAQGSTDTSAHAHCAHGTSMTKRTSCLERVTRQDIRGSSTSAAIARLEGAAKQDRQVAVDCHMALHPIGADAGERLAREGAPLPLDRPRSFCHEGYVHGMQVAWLDAATTVELIRTGARACDSSDPNIDWACGHSLGHVLAGRAGTAGMPTVMRWCAATYQGAVHLGLGRDGFLTTCAKGALMEFTLRDERAGTTDPSAHGCDEVTASLAAWCEGHVWLRAGLGADRAATAAEQLEACDDLARTPTGRAACAAMVGRSIDEAATCRRAATDLRAACQREVGKIVDPAATPSI